MNFWMSTSVSDYFKFEIFVSYYIGDIEMCCIANEVLCRIYFDFLEKPNEFLVEIQRYLMIKNNYVQKSSTNNDKLTSSSLSES